MIKRPTKIVKEQKKFQPREVGLTHPDNPSFFRVRDNGDIEIFAGDGVGIVICPETKSVSFVGDTVKVITNEDDGLKWNDKKFNSKATKFSEPTLTSHDVDDDFKSLYRGIEDDFEDSKKKTQSTKKTTTKSVDNTVSSTGTLRKFLAVAAAEVGYIEGSNNDNKYAAQVGHPNNQSWCATFIAAMAKKAGVSIPNPDAWTVTMADGFKKANRWFTTGPKAGDIVFYDFDTNEYYVNHVGIVERVISSTEIQTIEGNTASGNSGSQTNGGGVYRRNRPIDAKIVGYGRPTFRA